ncbi:MAG: hypothetical protein BWY37_01032 [Firmicutes bacterium ADurb.Bin262]|nr:MAG: hypothetical protein BWY37_01032 [Firmicutes bacterium ADurb.Bin262]
MFGSVLTVFVKSPEGVRKTLRTTRLPFSSHVSTAVSTVAEEIAACSSEPGFHIMTQSVCSAI